MADHSARREVVDGSGPVVIDSTMPPTSSYEMLVAEGATVLVFSHDATLARVIRNVAAERYPIRIIEAWSDLLQQVASGKGRIILLDVDAVSTDVEHALAEINDCSDWLVTIIAAKQQQAQDFMRFWSERRIHRLLIKPAAAGITRLLLESACARFIELRELHENTDSMEIPQDLLEAEQARERVEAEVRGRRVKRAAQKRRMSGRLRTLLRPGAVLKWAAVAVLAGALVYGYQYVNETGRFDMPVVLDEPENTVETATALPEASSPSPSSATADISAAPTDARAQSAPTSAVPAEADAFADLLQQARTAERQGRLTRPDGDSALDLYASILAQAPDHSAARAGLDAILDDLFMTAEARILSGEFAAAQAALADIERGNPSGTRLAFLSEQLRQMQQASAELDAARRAAQVEAAPVAPAQAPAAVSAPDSRTEIDSIVTLAQLRLTEGSLVTPAGDSARDYLLRARDLGMDSSELQPYADEFAGLSLSAIPLALSQGNLDAARAMLNTARQLGALQPELMAMGSEIDVAAAARSRASAAAMHARALESIDAENYTGSEDSAVELLTRLRAGGAEAGLISDVEARLTNALSRSIRAAIGSERWSDGRTLIGAFEQAALDPNVVRGLERDLTIAQQQSEFLNNVVPVGELELLESTPAEYPRSAIRAGITGWVDLQFTVDRNGGTRDIVVAGAEPSERFETAAVAALEQYRFAPYTIDGRTYERRARLRMRFELD